MSQFRFSQFNVAELQQLYLAVHHTEQDNIITPGPGNLLPGLRDELAVTLEAALELERE